MPARLVGVVKLCEAEVYSLLRCYLKINQNLCLKHQLLRNECIYIDYLDSLSVEQQTQQ